MTRVSTDAGTRSGLNPTDSDTGNENASAGSKRTYQGKTIDEWKRIFEQDVDDAQQTSAATGITALANEKEKIEVAQKLFAIYQVKTKRGFEVESLHEMRILYRLAIWLGTTDGQP